ncbi:hypothetical protein ACLB2K_032780 [Fragaria x ananassa]
MLQHITVTGLQHIWKLEVFLQAEADCSQAINLDKKNMKAYSRRGTVRDVLSYYEETIEGHICSRYMEMCTTLK